VVHGSGSPVPFEHNLLAAFGSVDGCKCCVSLLQKVIHVSCAVVIGAAW